MADSWGNLFKRRSACVPFPTPGAPTNMMRAAFRSFIVVILMQGTSQIDALYCDSDFDVYFYPYVRRPKEICGDTLTHMELASRYG